MMPHPPAPAAWAGGDAGGARACKGLHNLLETHGQLALSLYVDQQGIVALEQVASSESASAPPELGRPMSPALEL